MIIIDQGMVSIQAILRVVLLLVVTKKCKIMIHFASELNGYLLLVLLGTESFS